VKLLTTTLWDGRKIGYSDETVFLVQVGKGPKGSYQTRYKFIGELQRAFMFYNMINIGYPYKKRLFMPSSPNGTIARQVGL